MVTNLPPQAQAQYKKVINSKTKREKLENLRIFLSMIPKHKGTAKLVAQVKKQIARLEEEIEEEKKRKSYSKRRASIKIKKASNSLVVPVIYVNPSIIDEFLKLISEKETSSYYFDKPVSVNIERINLLIIPIAATNLENPEYLEVIMQSNVVAFLVSSTTEELETFYEVVKQLAKHNIYLINDEFPVEIIRTSTKRIEIEGKSRYIENLDEIREICQKNKCEGAIIRLHDSSTVYTIEAYLKTTIKRINYILILDKKILGNSKTIEESFSKNFSKAVILGLESLKEREKFVETLLSICNLMRIYTKQPSEEKPSEKPVLLRRGATVIDLAKEIHEELVRNFKYALVIRAKDRRGAIRVGKNFRLEEGDIVEIHE